MDESREFDYSDEETTTAHRAAHCPKLSVVLLSDGDRTDLERALEAIAGRCRRLEAETGSSGSCAPQYPSTRVAKTKMPR